MLINLVELLIRKSCQQGEIDKSIELNLMRILLTMSYTKSYSYNGVILYFFIS